MAVVNTVIYQVTGYQNSGKTTVILALIEELKKAGLKTATIKHHGHGGKPEAVKGKDSSKHLEAGAVASIIEGDGRLILQADHYRGNLQDQLRLLQTFKPDVVLIEGHKSESYPKILLLKNKDELSLIKQVNNVKAILYWEDGLKEYIEKETGIPSLLIHAPHAVKWITELILLDFK